MKIIWSPTAVAHLIRIHDFIEADKPEAAHRLTRKIASSIDLLARFSYIGRPGRDPGTRELIVAGTPYIISFRVRSGRLDILGVFDAAQDRS